MSAIVRACYRALDPGTSNRRLSDLERAGLVQMGKPRRAPSGRPEVAWWPVERQGVLL